MKRPKVSIMIPVYNREGLIGECIQSALDQTFADLEIVIVDNASVDNTWNVCRAFAEKDKRIRVYRNSKNIGPVGNWLRCIQESRGEFGKLLFSDDVMYPQFLEHTLPYLEDPDVAFVSTAVQIGKAPGQGGIYFRRSEADCYLPSSRYLDLLTCDAIMPYSPAAAIFRMEDIRDNLLASIPVKAGCDFARNGAGPDVLLYALTALKYKYVVMLPYTDMFFRAHTGSITESDQDRSVWKNYYAAIAWFCRQNMSRRHWAKYVARTWLYEFKAQHRPSSLISHCNTYEGDGSLLEVLLVSREVVRESLLFVLRQYRRSRELISQAFYNG